MILPISKYSHIFVQIFSNLSTVLYPHLWYKFNLHIVWSKYPTQIYILKYIYSPTLRPKGEQKLPNLHSSPQLFAWCIQPEYISNWHIFPKLLAVYIQYKYIFQLNYIPQHSNSNLCWHDISNTKTYIQLTFFPQIVGCIYPIRNFHY